MTRGQIKTPHTPLAKHNKLAEFKIRTESPASFKANWARKKNSLTTTVRAVRFIKADSDACDETQRAAVDDAGKTRTIHRRLLASTLETAPNRTNS